MVARRGPAPVNATALIRGMFHKVSDKPQPGMGVFPPDWLESTFMPAAVRKVTSTRALHEFSLQYGEPLGDSGLRRALSTKLAALNVPARRSRSSPRSAPRTRWTSSAARCCGRATR
jgi:DNA-binding transcriptional MocR family regulator